METLRTLLFEDPFYLYVSLGALAVLLLVTAVLRRSRRALVWALVAMALGGGVYAMERLVETDREQIAAAYAALAADAAAHRTEAFDRHIDRDYIGFEFAGYDVGRTATLLLARFVMERYNVQSVHITRMDITVHGDTADARINTIVRFGSGDAEGVYVLRWKNMEWVRRDDGWKLRRAALPELDPAAALE